MMQVVFVVYYSVFSTLVGDADSVCSLLSTLVGDADSVCGLLFSFHHSGMGCR